MIYLMFDPGGINGWAGIYNFKSNGELCVQYDSYNGYNEQLVRIK